MPKKYSPTHERAMRAWREGYENSDSALGVELGVSRAIISRWHIRFRKEGGTVDTSTVNDYGVPGSGYGSPVNPHGPGPTALPIPNNRHVNATISPQLRARAAEIGVDLSILWDKIVAGNSPRASALMAGFAARTHSDWLQRVPEYAALVSLARSVAASGPAENLHRLGSGNSPQAVPAATTWLERQGEDNEWIRPTQRIDQRLGFDGGISFAAILSSEESIFLASSLEAQWQQGILPEGQLPPDVVIENGAYKRLPPANVSSEELPPLPPGVEYDRQPVPDNPDESNQGGG